jgi:TRAP-type C4-dicarboxylate transport system permease small subunit
LSGSRPVEAESGGGSEGPVAQAMQLINRILIVLCCLALIAAALVLTQSVVVRYLLRETTDWQDETSVMLLVGATFLSAAYVQSVRGHVAIDALAGLLPERWDRRRQQLVDAASFAFCAFFAWKSWTLTGEAIAEGTVTSSTFAPPLWIPYATMAAGMSLLALQILVQLGQSLVRPSVR